jgi:DNA-binding XRE family transcriptional regulator
MYIIRFWRKGWFLRPFCQLTLRAVRVDSPPFARDPQGLAQSLTGYRSRENLTQQAFAAKLGVNRKTLNNWEKGRTRPIGKFWREIRSLLASHLA